MGVLGFLKLKCHGCGSLVLATAMQSAQVECKYCHTLLDVTGANDIDFHRDVQAKIGRYAIRLFQITMAMQDGMKNEEYNKGMKLLQQETQEMYQEIADYLNGLETPHERQNHSDSHSDKGEVPTL